MGTTRIKVIDLSSDVEQIKTSRKRAQTAALTEIKKPLIKEKKVKEKLIQQEPVVKDLDQTSQSKVVEEVKKEARVEILKPKASKPKGVTRSKKYQNAKLLVDNARQYLAAEALELVKKVNLTSFEGSCEAHIVVKQKNLRGFVTFPNPVKKQSKFLVFTSQKDGLEGDGISIGNEKTIQEIEERKLVPKKDFTLIISTPEFMPKLAKLGKILGPAGLMPNPKTGTVTEKPAEVIKKIGAGAVEFKTEAQAPVIHCVIGKVSQDIGQLKENLQALITAITPQRIEKIYLAPTMGPSIKVDLQSLTSNIDSEKKSH